MAEIAKISDIDGVSTAVAQCTFCQLNIHQEFLANKFCQNCYRLSYLWRYSKTFGKFFMPALLLSVFLIFTPYSSIAIIIPLIAVAPNVAMNGFQKQIIFFRVPEEMRVIPMFRYARKLNSPGYADKALELMASVYETAPESLQRGMINEIVNSIFLRIKPNPPGLFEKLSKITKKDMPELIEYLMTTTELKNAFKQVPGTGTLPDIWNDASDEIKKQILDLLVEDLSLETYASVDEKKLLMEDIYLMEEEIIEFIGDNKQWMLILDELEKFEPEEPPKNFLAEARRTAEEQAKLQQLSG